MVTSGDPVLHVGDRLRFTCPEVPEICVDRTVCPDGTVVIPLVGALPAASRKPSELGRTIEVYVSGGLFPPRIEVRWLGSATTEIVMTGSARFPLRVFAPRGIARNRLLDAAQPSPDADLAMLGDSRQVRPGTTLMLESIKADRLISVLGAVGTPRALAPANAMLLSSAIEAAGGLTAHGDSNAVTVVRNGEPIPVSIPADGGFLLQPGDVVRVGFIADRHYVIVKGGVVHPGNVEYAPGMTATQALTAAGGLLPDVTSGTFVWQTGSKTFRLSLSFLLQGRIPNPVLSANDTITIEGRP